MRKKSLWKKTASILLTAAMLTTSVPAYGAPPEVPSEIVVEDAEVSEKVVGEENPAAVNLAEEYAGEENTAQSDSPVSIGNQGYESLQAAVNGAQNNDIIVLEDNIKMAAENEIVTIPTGITLTLNMNGKEITCTEDFKGRPIVNEGTLTVTGNGTIDTSMSPSGGLGAINNKGILTILNGTYKGATYASGSCIRNTGSDAVLVIEDGAFNTATCAVYNEGTATIEGGVFEGTTCSSCNPKIWSYTLKNYTNDPNGNPKLYIHGGTVIGVQGAVSSSIGYTEITDGNFKTVKCKTNKDHTATFYALYVAGEVEKVKCVVKGGTFETEGNQAAVLIGNDNTGGDGGINADAICEIWGGTFRAPEGVLAIKGAEKTGDPKIMGGTFTSEVDLKYCPNGYMPIRNEDGTYSVTAGGVARIGERLYPTLQRAIDDVKSGETITLLENIDNGTDPITAENDFTLDLAGKKIVSGSQFVLYLKGDNVICDSSKEKTGEISTNSAIPGSKYALVTSHDNFLTIMGGTFTGQYAIQAQNGASLDFQNGTARGTEVGINVIGGKKPGAENPFKTTKLTVTDGQISGGIYGVVGNGNSDETEINLKGGTVSATNEADSFGVYHPQEGDLTLSGDVKISGANGVQYCGGGNLVISENAEIHATGAYTQFPSKPEEQGDGSANDGAALALVSRGSGYQDDGKMINANISGGTLSSDNNSAISVYRLKQIERNGKKEWVTNDRTGIENYLESLKITDGTFRGTTKDPKDVVEVESKANGKVKISGGTYTGDSNRLDGHIVTGYAKVEQGENTCKVLPKTADEKDAIESVTAEVKKDGTAVATEEVAVTIEENVLRVTGKITEGNQVVLTANSIYGETITVNIARNEQGVFVADPAQFTLSKGDVAYTIDISGLEILPAETLLEMEAPEVSAEGAAGDPEDVKEILEALKKADVVEANGLAAASGDVITKDGTVVAENREIDFEEAKKALKDGSVQVEEGTEVKLVVSSYLDIKIKSVENEALILGIIPMYVVKATTADDLNSMVEGEDGKNTVTVTKEPQKLTVDETVTITIPYPSIFTKNLPVYVKHTKDSGETYYYTTTVSDSDSAKKLTFVNPNGFSDFLLKQDGREGWIDFDVMGAKKYNLSNLGEALPTPQASEGQSFKGWEIGNKIYTNVTEELLDLFNNGVTIVDAKAVYESTSSGGGGITTPFYPITVPAETEGGKVIVSPNPAKQGDTVTVTVEPKEGYELKELMVTDAGGTKIDLTKTEEGKFTFTMPGSGVKIEAVFEKAELKEQEIKILKAQVRGLADRDLNDRKTKVKFAKDKAPKTAVTYESSNDKVVSVDKEGHIRYTGLGEAVITVKAEETEEYKAAEVSVTVKVGLRQPTFTPTPRDNGFIVTSSTVRGAESFQVQYVLKGRSFKHESAKSKTFTVDDKLRKGKVSAADKKTYRVRVRAIHGDVKSKWSPVKNITTK